MLVKITAWQFLAIRIGLKVAHACLAALGVSMLEEDWRDTSLTAAIGVGLRVVEEWEKDPSKENRNKVAIILQEFEDSGIDTLFISQPWTPLFDLVYYGTDIPGTLDALFRGAIDPSVKGTLEEEVVREVTQRAAIDWALS